MGSKISFGKYAGKTIQQIAQTDKPYLKWLAENTDPTDAKNNGKYAKANQARIKEIEQALQDAPAFDSPSNSNSSLMAVLISIETKLDKLIEKVESNDVI